MDERLVGLFAVATVWLLAQLVLRRRLITLLRSRRITPSRAAVAIGLLWAIIPLVALIWQPSIPIVLVIAASAVTFVAAAAAMLTAINWLGLPQRRD
ncbi:MAG: hypothetical protein M3N29_03660 [Chloroflexota bacterium]|nr:hypothetical protein [Chloroflexota bacterium]